MSQTTTNTSIPEARAGLIADVGSRKVISRAAEGNLLFGLFVTRGTDNDVQAKLPALAADIVNAATTKALGFTVREQTIENKEGSIDGRKDKETVGILKDGNIWVRLSSGSTPIAEQDVYIRFQNGEEGFATETNTGDTDLLGNAKFVGTEITVDSILIAQVRITK